MSSVERQINKGNWPGVIVLLAISIVTALAIYTKVTINRADRIADDCREKESLSVIKNQKREDSIVKAFQSKIDLGELRRIAEKDDLIARLDSRLEQIEESGALNKLKDRVILRKSIRNNTKTKELSEKTKEIDNVLNVIP